MTSILGISAFYHDSAAALIIDGDIVAAAQEERFSRKKHDARYPFNAVNFVLNEGRLKLSEVDHIVFFEKPFLKFERLLETYMAFAPKGFKSFSLSSLISVAKTLAPSFANLRAVALPIPCAAAVTIIFFLSNLICQNDMYFFSINRLCFEFNK